MLHDWNHGGQHPDHDICQDSRCSSKSSYIERPWGRLLIPQAWFVELNFVKVPQFLCVPSANNRSFISQASDTKPNLLIDFYVNALHLWVQILLVIPYIGQEHLNQIWVSIPSQLQEPVQLLKHEPVTDLIKFLLLEPLKT